MTVLVLFVRALELLVRFFKLHDLRGQLRVASVMLTWRISVVQVALHVLPWEGFFRSNVLLILTALSRVMGVVHAPMLLA